MERILEKRNKSLGEHREGLRQREHQGVGGGAVSTKWNINLKIGDQS